MVKTIIRFLIPLVTASVTVAADPLPSWQKSASKRSIIRFVESVTDEDKETFVPIADRIAVFDNDGTLWSEKPIYFQLAFAIDRVKDLADDHPEWKTEQPYKAVLENDLKTLVAGGHAALLKIMMATHAGMTTEEFEQITSDWINTARHPETGRLYSEMVYQPMLEVLQYLRENGFKTWIVSGGGIEFMRPWSQRVYGIPPEQVVGSSIKVKYEIRDSQPSLIRLPEIDFIDDKAGKPVAIHRFIGRRPLMAFGNSDGDLEMLQWATSGQRPGFALIVHHTDAAREAAYDRDSSVGRLDKALNEAKAKGWTVMDMKRDWKAIYPKAD